MELQPTDIVEVGWIYDYALLVALPYDMRLDYLHAIDRLSGPNTQHLLSNSDLSHICHLRHLASTLHKWIVIMVAGTRWNKLKIAASPTTACCTAGIWTI